ncbi:MAG: hypothetical protein IJ809_04530 [Clostridia bacterium]|nr:hypothetical protein [Clostridia bacterium]
MRYYLYVDKDFIEALFGSIAGSNFDIEVLEFSLNKSQTITRDFNVSPGIDKYDEKGLSTVDKEKNVNKDKHDRSIRNFKAFAGETNTFNTSVERKYINIEEVSNIKKQAFYYKLIEKIEEDIESENLCRLSGRICPCKLKNPYIDVSSRSYEEDNLFFNVENKYVWLEKDKLHSDLLFLSTITKQINVIGFKINQGEENEIVKAIAIYI